MQQLVEAGRLAGKDHAWAGLALSTHTTQIPLHKKNTTHTSQPPPTLSLHCYLCIDQDQLLNSFWVCKCKVQRDRPTQATSHQRHGPSDVLLPEAVQVLALLLGCDCEVWLLLEGSGVCEAPANLRAQGDGVCVYKSAQCVCVCVRWAATGGVADERRGTKRYGVGVCVTAAHLLASTT